MTASGRPTYLLSSHRIAAATSSFSPIPSSNRPVLCPAPRKLKRSAAKPAAAAALAARYTTRLSIVPPYTGCGWQTTTAPRGGPSGSRRFASRFTDSAGIINNIRISMTGSVTDSSHRFHRRWRLGCDVVCNADDAGNLIKDAQAQVLQGFPLYARRDGTPGIQAVPATHFDLHPE